MGNTVGRQILAGVIGFGNAIKDSLSYAFTGATIGGAAGPVGAIVGVFAGLTAGIVKGTIETVNAINEVDEEEQAVAESQQTGAPKVGGGSYGTGFTPEKLANTMYGAPAKAISLIEAGILGGDDPQARDFVKNLRAGNTLRGSWNAAGMNMVNREMSKGVDVQIGKFLQQRGSLPPRMVAIMGDPLLRSQFLAAQGSSTTRSAYNNVIYGASSAMLARSIMGTAQQPQPLPERASEGAQADQGMPAFSAFEQDAYARSLGKSIASGAPTAFVQQTM